MFSEDAAVYESYQRIGPTPVGLGGGGGSVETSRTADGSESSDGLGHVLHKSDDLQRRLRALLEATDAFFTPEDDASVARAMEQQYWTPVQTDSFENDDWQGEPVAVAPSNMPQRRANPYQRPMTTLEAVHEVSCEEGTPSPTTRSPALVGWAPNTRKDQVLGEMLGMSSTEAASPVSIALSPLSLDAAKLPAPPPMSAGAGAQAVHDAATREPDSSSVAVDAHTAESSTRDMMNSSPHAQESEDARTSKGRRIAASSVHGEGLREGLQSSIQETEAIMDSCIKRVSVKARELETRLLVADARTQKTALFLARTSECKERVECKSSGNAGGGENIDSAASKAASLQMIEEWMGSQEQQLDGLRDAAVEKLSAWEQGAARMCGGVATLKEHLARQKAHRDALDELLSKAERSVAAAYQDKQELEIENRMLRSELDALRQHLEQRGAQDGEHAKDQETMKYLRQECERIAAECTNLKDTNSQLTRKLSASLKNKVELEKVQTAREQLEVSSSEHMTALL